MATISRLEASNLVGKIRRKNGGMTDEERETWPSDAVEMISTLRRQLAASTRTLATNLYSSDARFLYELIQNAEDNQYEKAISRGERPRLEFILSPSSISIETNEDGFQEKHVQAICSIGESSKENVQGYIGEKGIGFKSIFKVAQKVRIQSGPFSFAFTHTQSVDEDGLGMVTPFDHPFSTLLSPNKTRFVLTPRVDSSFDQRAKDLEELPITFLLFFEKLKEIVITITPLFGNWKTTSYSASSDFTHNMGSLVKTVTEAGRSKITTQKFHVFRRTIRDLPEETARSGISSAEIVLAFPVDEHNIPSAARQHTYAYLPIRNLGFNFVIQSDFITQASREDIFDSPWNRALRQGVAETFRDAVLNLCLDPELKYTWMRYLPAESIADDFWRQLRPQILELLRLEPIVRSWSDRLHRAHILRIVPSDVCDDLGAPLFRDIEPEIYLSKQYNPTDHKNLEAFGLQIMTAHQFLDRFQADLLRLDSKFKAGSTTMAWHSRVVSVLCDLLTETWCVPRITELNIIPLHRGQLPPAVWISASKGSIYYPDCEGVLVPETVKLRVIDPSVCGTSRNRLWKQLGVQHLQPAVGILQVTARFKSASLLTVEQAIDLLHFLFWHLQNTQTPLDSELWIIDTQNQRVRFMKSQYNHLYFPNSAGQFAAKALLSCPEPSNSWRFLDERYLLRVSPSINRNGRSWRQFLQEAVMVSDHPRLLLRGAKTLSSEFKSIQETRSDQLVGLLWTYKTLYLPEIGHVRQDLMKAKVPVDGGSMMELKDTVFPAVPIVQTLEALGVIDFPFLVVPTEMVGIDPSELTILSRLGVETSENLSLYLKALVQVQKFHERAERIPHTLVRIYEKLSEYADGTAGRAKLKTFFKTPATFIFCTPRFGSDAWLPVDECVWDAPEWAIRLQGLSRQQELHHLRTFFCEALSIRQYKWQDAIDELITMNCDGTPDMQKLCAVYQYLSRNFEGDQDHVALREAFEVSNLVYSRSESSWFPPSECVWADGRIPIPGLCAIALDYSGLEGFFQNMLLVQAPDLSMHVRSLLELGRHQPQDAHTVKEAILLVSSLRPKKADLEPLSASNIFHVRLANGNLQWTNKAASFFINDRNHYAEAFKTKVAMLDFTLEEVRIAEPFFRVFGTANKYLSTSVKASTEVGNGRLDLAMTQNFRSKAFAICRYAKHHYSPLVATDHGDLYQRLQGMTVFTSRNISRRLGLFHYGREITVDSEASGTHLDTENGSLKLYLPKKRADRDLCLMNEVPKKIIGFLGIKNPAAEALLSHIINLQRLRTVVTLLNDEGVVEVEGLVAPILEGDDDSDTETEAEAEAETVVTSVEPTPIFTPASTPRPTQRARTPPSVTSLTTGSRQPESTPQNETNLSRASTPVPKSINLDTSSGYPNPAAQEPSIGWEYPTIDVRSIEPGYRAILDRVRTASMDRQLPTCGANKLYAARGLLTTFESLFSGRSMDRDKKVGAAGELFVYELLKANNLRLFGYHNWRSTMRKEVRVHPAYADLSPWNGRETSDIVYKDDDMDLGEKLRACGYLDPALIERREFYIEVKTTTGSCEDTFFMSGAQYARMQQRSADKLYLLFRVFCIDKEKIGLRIFVDPELARQRGELTFTVDTWTGRVV